MFTKMKKSTIGWAATVVCLTFAGVSDARCVGGYAGQPAGGAALSCFNEFFGAVQSTCSGGHNWEVPLMTDSSGAKTVHMTGSAGANALSCSTYGLNSTATSYWAGSQLNWVNQGATYYTSTGASIPSGGYLYVYCSFAGAGAQLDTLDWNS
ncbi:MAG TPA: hypothetical protein VH062_27690 [Polyangiaceae bacterium]|jgi:hypothetical protein|nr:hypothetical protein [Polyangiaceae bacterium]